LNVDKFFYRFRKSSFTLLDYYYDRYLAGKEFDDFTFVLK